MNKPQRFEINTTSFAHYWSEGAGKSLLEKLPGIPDLQQAEKLVPLLFEVDQLADRVVEELYFKNGFHHGDQALQQLLENGVRNEDSDNVKQLFSSLETIPDWVDEKLLAYGSDLSQRAGLASFIVLRNYSLMGGYESAAINKPLIFTGALKKGAVKRLSETVEFWVNITGSNALKRDEIGFKSIVRTRMIHAYSRLAILKSGSWENQKWGAPLNAWDMLATNLGFSLVYLVGLRKMGIEPSEKEIEGLFHFWKYVGYLLGIPVNLLPENEQQAIEQLYYWTMTQSAADADSIALAHALLNEPMQTKYPKIKWMRQLVQQTHLAYNYYLLGKYSCESLQLPASRFTWAMRYTVFLHRRFQKKADKSMEDYYEQVKKGRDAQVKVSRLYSENVD